MSRGSLAIAALFTLISVAQAGALTNEDKCLAGRVKAAGKYQKCIQYWDSDDGFPNQIGMDFGFSVRAVRGGFL